MAGSLIRPQAIGRSPAIATTAATLDGWLAIRRKESLAEPLVLFVERLLGGRHQGGSTGRVRHGTQLHSVRQRNADIQVGDLRDHEGLLRIRPEPRRDQTLREVVRPVV